MNENGEWKGKSQSFRQGQGELNFIPNGLKTLAFFQIKFLNILPIIPQLATEEVTLTVLIVTKRKAVTILNSSYVKLISANVRIHLVPLLCV